MDFLSAAGFSPTCGARAIRFVFSRTSMVWFLPGNQKKVEQIWLGDATKMVLLGTESGFCFSHCWLKSQEGSNGVV
jgi:hypothetical protein